MNSSATDTAYSLLDVAGHLQVTPDTLRQWNHRFAEFLGGEATTDLPRYAMADVATLLTIQKLIEQGFNDDQINQRLKPKRIQIEVAENTALTKQNAGSWVDGANASQAVSDLLSTIANSQQTVLNSQNTVREMVSVVVQDNFNLKEENRKLRERMLELERDQTEYQRKEETRRERSESRMRALEGTVSALQQQVAQLMQIQRQAIPRRKGWW